MTGLETSVREPQNPILFLYKTHVEMKALSHVCIVYQTIVIGVLEIVFLIAHQIGNFTVFTHLK